MMCGFRLCWLGLSPMEVGGFRWARLWVPMDGSAVGGYGSIVLVVEAFVVGSNVGVDDGNDKVGVWVDGDDNDGNEDGGFGVWVDLDYEGFGFGSGCG